ncbi:hypothetical protein TNCV_2127761 [Trichonephila clavipes]|nr:hypothetical protein TNCV_2127761 [Trichonephila clavipes]
MNRWLLCGSGSEERKRPYTPLRHKHLQIAEFILKPKFQEESNLASEESSATQQTKGKNSNSLKKMSYGLAMKRQKIEEISDMQCPIQDKKPRESSPGTWKRRNSTYPLGVIFGTAIALIHSHPSQEEAMICRLASIYEVERSLIIKEMEKLGCYANCFIGCHPSTGSRFTEAPVYSRTLGRHLAEGHFGSTMPITGSALDAHPSTSSFGVVPHTRKLDCAVE